MLGMLGIIVQNNEIKNTTQILQVITPGEKYLVKFLNAPVFQRVCMVDEIQQWLLFATQEEANAWVQASSGPPPQQGELLSGKPPAGNGAANKADANDPSDPKLQDDGIDNPLPNTPATPATPVTPVDPTRFQRPTKKEDDR